MSLTKSQILGAAFPEPVKVHVPQWGGDVYVSVMDGKKREQFERALVANDSDNLRAMALVFTLTDPEGNPVFGVEDIDRVNRLEARVLMRLHKIALDLNRIDDDQVEELAGN